MSIFVNGDNFKFKYMHEGTRELPSVGCPNELTYGGKIQWVFPNIYIYIHSTLQVFLNTFNATFSWDQLQIGHC
jgi:hypothetical protein